MNIESSDWSLLPLAANLSYLEELETRLRTDASGIDPALVELIRRGAMPVASHPTVPHTPSSPAVRPTSAPGPRNEPSPLALEQSVRSLVNAYRTFGHVAADLDPLQLAVPSLCPDLSPSAHNLTEADLDRIVPANAWYGHEPGQS